MSKILTVEEEFDKFKETIDVYETDDNGGLFESKVKQFAIEFAKLHLQAQQEAILKVLENRGEHNNIDKNIIINSYPLNLIK